MFLYNNPFCLNKALARRCQADRAAGSNPLRVRPRRITCCLDARPCEALADKLVSFMRCKRGIAPVQYPPDDSGLKNLDPCCPRCRTSPPAEEPLLVTALLQDGPMPARLKVVAGDSGSERSCTNTPESTGGSGPMSARLKVVTGGSCSWYQCRHTFSRRTRTTSRECCLMPVRLKIVSGDSGSQRTRKHICASTPERNLMSACLQVVASVSHRNRVCKATCAPIMQNALMPSRSKLVPTGSARSQAQEGSWSPIRKSNRLSALMRAAKEAFHANNPSKDTRVPIRERNLLCCPGRSAKNGYRASSTRAYFCVATETVPAFPHYRRTGEQTSLM